MKIWTPDLDWPQFMVYRSTSWRTLGPNNTIQVTENGWFNLRPYVVILSWVNELELERYSHLHNSVNQLEWLGLAHPTLWPRHVLSNDLSGMKIRTPYLVWPQFVVYRSTSWTILNPNNIQVTEKGWSNSRPYVAIIHPVMNQWIRYSRYALRNDHDCIIL